MGKLSISVIWTSPIPFAVEVTHTSDMSRAKWPTEFQKLFEIKPSGTLMAARESFIYRRNINYESLESMMNKRHVSMPGGMKLLKQAPAKRTAVLKGSQAFAVHNPRTHFHPSCKKM